MPPSWDCDALCEGSSPGCSLVAQNACEVCPGQVTEHKDFIKCHCDLGAQVALNIVQQSRGCLHMTKLYYFAVPQFSHQLIGLTIL